MIPTKPNLKKGESHNRPNTGQKESEAELDLGLAISGNKIRKGHKLPERYQVSTTQSKPNLKPGSPNKPPTQAPPSQPLLSQTLPSQPTPNQFETYMQVKMVLPENKEIYHRVHYDKEQLRKIASKPFERPRQTSARQKQELINNESDLLSSSGGAQIQQNGSRVSEGSTKLSSNQSNSKQSHPNRGSQDLAGFEKELSATTRSQVAEQAGSRSSKPFRLNDIVRTEQSVREQLVQASSSLFKPDQWVLKNKLAKTKLDEIIQEKSEDIKQLESYISGLRSQNRLPKDFDKNVKRIVSQIRDQSDSVSQVSEQLDNSSKPPRRRVRTRSEHPTEGPPYLLSLC